MDTCIVDTCIVDTCIVDTCIVGTCIMDACIINNQNHRYMHYGHHHGHICVGHTA